MTDFTLRELECFTAVADELSFTAAAKRLNLSQPPLSRHIRVLEQRLGKALFERSKRHVALTQAGRVFLRETEGVLMRLNRAQQRVREEDSRFSDSVEIAFVSALLSTDLGDRFLALKEKCREILITLHDYSPKQQLESIEAGLLDLGFIGLRPERSTDRLEFALWRREPLVALMGNEHPLAASHSLVFSEIGEHSLVAVANDAAPAFARFIRDGFARSGCFPNVTQEAARAQAVAVMAVAGDSVALLPESATRMVSGGVVIPVAHPNRKPIYLEEVIAYRKAAPRAVIRCLEVLLASN